MKHALKKSLAVLLAMFMLLGATVIGAAAESAPGTEEESIPEQVEVIEGDNAVQAEEESPKKLVAPKTEITITVGDYVSMADLLEGTTWDIKELSARATFWGDKIELDWDEDAAGYKGFTGVKGGKVMLDITAPDGEKVTIYVTVKNTFKSWLQGVYEGVKLFFLIVLAPIILIVIEPIIYLLQLFGWKG